MITTLNNGTKVVHYGHGTVGGTKERQGNKVLVNISENDKVLPIGVKGYKVNHDYEVILSFCNVNSIDVMIGTLEEAKELLMR